MLDEALVEVELLLASIGLRGTSFRLRQSLSLATSIMDGHVLSETDKLASGA